jgi:RecA-family ATPase
MEDEIIEFASPAQLEEDFESSEAVLEREAEAHLVETYQQEELDKLRRSDPDFISGYTMSRKSYPKQKCLIGPALLPKAGKMLLTAENGTGKSVLAMHIAACLTTGTPLFGFKHTHKGKDYNKPVFPVYEHSTVVYLDYEIPEAMRWDERMKPLVETFGEAFIENILFPRRPSDYRLENGRYEREGAFDKLLIKMVALKPNVLIIDPFSSTHSLDENSNEIKQALNNIDKIIDNSGTAVILVHHASTKVLRDHRGNIIEKAAKEKARGWSGITDWADLVVHVEEVKEKGNPKETKVLSLDFAKTRFCRAPNSRAIRVNFETMVIEPILQGQNE